MRITLLPLLLLLCVACKQQAETSKPNILFLFTDDQRYNTINALGNDEIHTPHLDKLAHRGCYFTNAYIMGSMSGAVCAPSRAMLMTGRNLYHIHPQGSTIDAEHPTLPETLSKNGYYTFHTGKWHNGKESFARSFDTAAAVFFGGMSDHYNVPLHHFNAEGNYPNDDIYHIQGKHSAEIYADAAIAFLNEYKGDDPFFMYVSFQSPHDPRNMPKLHLDQYAAENIKLPPNYMPYHPFDNGELDIRDELLAGFPRTPDEVKANIAAYYAMITHTDAQIGRIIQTMEDKTLADNTIIVFAGDNGLAVGQHGLMGKQNLYEHSIKVPLLFAGPGIPENQTTESFAYLHDIYPTLCSLTGIPIAESVMGKSLKPSFDQQQYESRSNLIFAYKTFQRAMRKDNWKLTTYNVNDTIRYQLFDLKNDPYETTNLYHFPEYSDTAAYLMEVMQRQFTEAGDSVNFSKTDWNLDINTQSWKEKIKSTHPEVYQHLMEMAEQERNLRGF